MPKIGELGGMKIYLYYDDHDPPHFHVMGQEKTRIEIQTGEYLSGDDPLSKPKERDLLHWLQQHKDDIMKGSDNCRNGLEPAKIPPLY